MKYWALRIGFILVAAGIVLLAGSCNPFDPVAAAGFGDLKIYWMTNDGKIYRNDLEGQDVTLVLDIGSTTPKAFTVDPVNDKIYWSEDNGGPSSGIFRADTDGADQETFHSDIVASSIAVDYKNGNVYIASTSGNIFRKDIGQAGSGTLEDIYFSGGADMFITLDLTNNYIYWNEAGNAHIGRDQISSSLTYTVFDDADANGSISSIVVSDSGDEVYWLNSYTGAGIIRKSRDGSSREVVYPGLTIVGAVGVAIDPFSNKVYFPIYAMAGGTVNMGTTDGATPQAIVQNIVDGPLWIAIDLWP